MGACDIFGYCHVTICFSKDYHAVSVDWGKLNKLLFHYQRLKFLWVFHSQRIEIRCNLLHKRLSLPEVIQSTSFVRVASERIFSVCILNYLFVECERYVHPLILVFHVAL